VKFSSYIAFEGGDGFGAALFHKVNKILKIIFLKILDGNPQF
jgi:hypothetical protein